MSFPRFSRHSLPLFKPVAAVAASLLFASTFAFADSNTWDISTARKGTDGNSRIVGSGGRTLTIDDPDIAVVDDPGAPGGKALEFGGAQKKSPGVGKPYSETTSFSVKFSVNPNDSGTGEQTILLHSSVFEIRYSATKKDLTLYLQQPDKKPAVKSALPLQPGVWTAVELVVKDEKISFKVGSQHREDAFPEGATIPNATAFLRIGMALEGNRPFIGRLADLTVSEPAE